MTRHAVTDGSGLDVWGHIDTADLDPPDYHRAAERLLAAQWAHAREAAPTTRPEVTTRTVATGLGTLGSNAWSPIGGISENPLEAPTEPPGPEASGTE